MTETKSDTTTTTTTTTAETTSAKTTPATSAPPPPAPAASADAATNGSMAAGSGSGSNAANPTAPATPAAVTTPPPVPVKTPTPVVVTKASTNSSTTPKPHHHSMQKSSSATKMASTITPGAVPKNSEERAKLEISKLIENGYIKNKNEIPGILGILNDNAALREKVNKLKSLLGRSAKVQRESKLEVDASNKKLIEANNQIEKLNKKINHLITRPTHMDLLADFESNFDRALLRVGQQQQQTVGQDTAAPQPIDQSTAVGVGGSSLDSTGGGGNNGNVVDTMLMQELKDSKSRIEKLESLNKALLSRSSQLEVDYKTTKSDYDSAMMKVSHLELELRVTKMEASEAKKSFEEKAASLQEMQMEIDMVTKASMNAQRRAAHGEEFVKNYKNKSEHIHELEQQIVALQEWALASAEAKQISLERVSELEVQLRKLHGSGDGDGSYGDLHYDHHHQNEVIDLQQALSEDNHNDRLLYSKKSSMVVGAGDVGSYVVDAFEQSSTVEEMKEIFANIPLNEKLIIKWKFDILPNDQSIYFSILQGSCNTKSEQKRAKLLCIEREVISGAAGETIIDVHQQKQHSCTLLWSNKKSWVRPRTISFTIEMLIVDPNHHDY